jgi:hypothetical protein
MHARLHLKHCHGSWSYFFIVLLGLCYVQANAEVGALDPARAAAIVQAAEEVAQGKGCSCKRSSIHSALESMDIHPLMVS